MPNLTDVECLTNDLTKNLTNFVRYSKPYVARLSGFVRKTVRSLKHKNSQKYISKRFYTHIYAN